MRDRSSQWLLLSAVLHGAGLMALVTPEPRSAPVSSPEDVVEFELLTVRDAPAQTTAEPVPFVGVRAQNPNRRVASRHTARTALTPAKSALSVREVETRVPSGVGPGGADDVAPSPAWGTLDPRAAALSVFDPNVELPVPSAAEKLNEAIVRGATRPPDRPPDPVLKRGPHGGYVFTGNGFTATISSSGEVDMDDRYGTVHIPLVPYQTPTGEWRFALLGGTFQLYDWLERKFGKNDLAQSERRWFLDRTRALRERLAREHAPRFLVRR